MTFCLHAARGLVQIQQLWTQKRAPIRYVNPKNFRTREQLIFTTHCSRVCKQNNNNFLSLSLSLSLCTSPSVALNLRNSLLSQHFALLSQSPKLSSLSTLPRDFRQDLRVLMVVDRWVWVLFMVVGTMGCCFCFYFLIL